MRLVNLCLNTSHVKVKRLKEMENIKKGTHLNTSHVKIQQVFLPCIKDPFLHLNTSHVKVKKNLDLTQM